MIYKGFVGPTYTLQSVTADCQRCINFIPQVDESGAGKAQITYIGTPGLTTYAALGPSPVRAMYTASNGRVFAVAGNNFYELLGQTVSNPIGRLLTDSGVVSVADNGRAIFMVDGPYGYIFDFTSNAFSQQLSENFHGGDTITFQDGYFLFNQPDTQQFWYTGQYSTAIDGAAFEQVEGSPDNLLCILSDGQQVWMFGDTSTEVWVDQGDANNPFIRNTGGFIKRGCAAKFTPKLLGGVPYWLAKDEYGQGVVLRAKGYTDDRISTHAMEQEIQRYPQISDAEAWTYQQDGHSFYVLNFPSAGKTWVFDALTGMWHERAYTGDGVLQQALPRNHCFGFGLHLVGSYLDGTVYVLDPEAVTDGGNEITRLRRAPDLNNENQRIAYSSIEFDMATGLGNGTNEPQAILRFSNDSGQTWSNEKYASLGKIGEVSKRVIFRRLGQGRNRVFELKITDPVKIAIQGAFLQPEGLAS